MAIKPEHVGAVCELPKLEYWSTPGSARPLVKWVCIPGVERPLVVRHDLLARVLTSVRKCTPQVEVHESPRGDALVVRYQRGHIKLWLYDATDALLGIARRNNATVET